MRNLLLKEHYFKVEVLRKWPASKSLPKKKTRKKKKTANKSRKKGGLGSFDKPGGYGKRKQ